MRLFLLSLLLAGCAFAQTQVDYQTQVKRKPITSGTVLPTSCTIASNLFFLTTTKALYVCDGTKYGAASVTLNVQGFGATGNGTTDDTAAFQAAYATAVSLGGGNIFMPCTAASYHVAGTVTVAVPTVSVTGENITCTKVSHPEAGRPFIWQMNPFTIKPAGTFSNFTIIGSSAASEGILGGQSVGATYENINTSGFTGSGAAGIHWHNAGSLSTWTEQNSLINVGLGGAGDGLYNTNGLLMDSDDPQDSFGHNHFINVHLNVSTGQVGLNLQSGFFNLSDVNLDCNVDNALVGSTAGLCFRSNGNWDKNTTHISGEFQTPGPGTGTQYAGKVEAGAGFKNLTGSTMVVVGAGDIPLPLNNLTSPTTSPNVTLVQDSGITSWDTGAFTLNGIATTPQPIQRFNFGSLGMLQGNNIESPYVTMPELTGNRFIIGSLSGSSPIGSMTPRFTFDYAGNEAVTGQLWVNWPLASLGSVDPNAVEDINGKLAVRGAQNHYNSGIGSAMSLGGITVSGMAGYSNLGLTSTTGYNESIIFDGNSDATYGAFIGSNVAHPVTSCYVADLTCFEWHTKTFGVPLSSSDLIASLDHSGHFTMAGNQVTSNYGSSYPTQGFYSSFNLLSGGESDLITQHGGGAGGFAFCDTGGGSPTCQAQLSAAGKLTLNGGLTSAAPTVSTMAAPNDNFGLLHFSSGTATNVYTMTGTYSAVYCVVSPIIANSLGSISIVQNLVSGHWQINAQAGSSVGPADVNYHCDLVQ